MLFVEVRFFAFFAVVLSVYWGLRTNESRKWFLLGASYFFYGSWDWRFAVMLAVLSYGDYFFARKIGETSDSRRKKRFVTASLAMNLTVLGIFKYCNFFVASAIGLAGSLGLHLDQPTLSIILPVGVSFFTFQSLSYTIDVYRGEIEPVRSTRDYLLFAAFFPQLVAGPIVRPKYFLPQLESNRSIDSALLKQALVLFVFGFIKKSCIADNVSPYVDMMFHAPSQYSNLAVVTGVWLYAVQIYCDFSGYSDMAIAVAAFMGYKLTLNFNSPYLAASLQDFWRRWHISLSTWIRDYIYVSLGGRSAKRLKTYRNIVYTMLAGGLWHGASWTFVVWGGLHGLGQVAQQEFNRSSASGLLRDGYARKILSWFLTLQFVCICWILFRSPDFLSALQITAKYLFFHTGGAEIFPTRLTLLPILLLLVHFVFYRVRVADRFSAASLPSYSFAMGVTVAFAIAMLPLGYRPFIYFQF
jgi:alginate O-acetyltransferase complex protein AlgI